MILKDAIINYQKIHQISDSELIKLLNISQAQYYRIKKGYLDGLSVRLIKTIAQVLRLSVDELIDLKPVIPFNLFPLNINGNYFDVTKDYPELFIKTGDKLHIRTFFPNAAKEGDIVVIYDGKELDVIRHPGEGTRIGGQIVYHVVGVSRIGL